MNTNPHHHSEEDFPPLHPEAVILSPAKGPRIPAGAALPRALAFLFALILASTATAQAPLRPTGLTYDTAGNLFYADTARHQIYESTLAGTLILIAGTGEQGYSGDGAKATAATLNSPQAVALAPTGTLYIADTANNRVRAVDPATGIITTVASGLHSPSALALDTAGNLLIADTAAHQILRLTGTTLTPIAGTGTQGFSGDSGPATAATLDTPTGLAALPDGRIVIADTHNHRLRILGSPSGSAATITTLAGTGQPGFSGDFGPASAAQLASPRGLTALPDGTILFADSNNHRLRSISPTGIITTLTGTTTQGLAPDPAPAATATLDTPRAIAATPTGIPVFTDRLIRALIDTNLYTPATESPRTSTLIITATSAAATITVQGTAGTPRGTVTLTDNIIPIATSALINAATTVPLTLAPGVHTLTATYSGDGFNPSTTSTTTLTIGLIATTTTLAAPAPTYAGLPLTLSAQVTPANATGTITFTESGSPIATAHLSNGIATGAALALTAGQHTILASYSGDPTHAPSTSASALATLNPMPAFDLTVTGASTQTALNGATVTYTLALTADPAPFSGAIALSATGLPSTTTVTFAPPQVIPGAASATTTLSIPTDKLLASNLPPPTTILLALTPFLLFFRRRKSFLPLLSCLALPLLASCGTRTAPDSATAAARTYYLTVTATAVDLAGAVITRSTPLTLNVR